MAIRVAVIEESEVFRRGLVASPDAEQGVSVVFQSDGGPVEAEADVVVVSGPLLRNVGSDGVPVIVLSEHPGGSPPTFAANVFGVLPRDGLTPEQLAVGVRAAAAGLRVDPNHEEPDEILDPRRTEVLRLLADGADTRAIATQLRCSERTVKSLVHDVMTRLGVQTRAQAVAEGIRRGLI